VIQIPREPNPGEPVSSLWGALVSRCLRALRPVASEDIIPQEGLGGVRFVLSAKAKKLMESVQYPFDANLTTSADGSPAVTFIPGTANALLPDNMYDKFPYTPTDVVLLKVVCYSDGRNITSCSMEVDANDPEPQVPTPSGLPSVVKVPVGVIVDGKPFRLIENKSVTLSGTEQFRVDRAAPAQPGQLPYIPYYAWVLQ